MTNIFPVDKGQPKQYTLWIILSAFILFYLIKFLQNAIIEAFFEQQNYSLLNFLSGTKTDQPLSFYLGRINKMFFGPLTMLISGMGFVYGGWRYLRDSHTKIFFSAVFLYLILTRWEVLFFPPYGDTIAGPFAEAIWLFHHGFDYASLAKEPGYIYGGPKVYLFSIYPTFLALLMTWISSTKAFLIVNHLIALGMGAGIVALFREILKTVTNNQNALLTALVLLFIPLFQGQVEMINMEIPMTFFAVWAMFYLVKKKMGMACIMAVISTMVKGVAIYMPAAVAVISLWLFFFDMQKRFQWKKLFVAFAGAGFVFLKLYAAFFILNEEGSADMVGLLEGWFEMKYFPETYLFLIGAFLFGGWFFWQWIKKKDGFLRLFNKHYCMWIFLIAAAGWFAVFINSYAQFPRYRLLVIPFILFISFYVLQLFIKRERLLSIVIIGYTLCSLICSYGLAHPKINNEKDQVQDHVILERSLEYRNDMKFRVKLARDIEERFEDYKIGAPFLLAHSLGLPELGYVSKKLDVMIYGFPCKLEGITVFHGLEHLDLRKTIWIAVVSDVPEHMKRFGDYPVDPKDIIVEERRYGKRQATLFKGGVAMERMRLISKEVLKQLHKNGLLKDPNLHNFGLEDVERHR